MWAVAAGSEWFYPEGPARPFSAGTGAAPFPPAMAFTFAAFCYMLALLLTAALIFFAIWHVSSRGRGKEGEVAAQPLLAPGPSSGRPRSSEVGTLGMGPGRGGAGRAAGGLRVPPSPGSGAAGPGGVETSGGWLAAPAVSRRRPRAPLLFPRGVGRPRC